MESKFGANNPNSGLGFGEEVRRDWTWRSQMDLVDQEVVSLSPPISGPGPDPSSVWTVFRKPQCSRENITAIYYRNDEVIDLDIRFFLSDNEVMLLLIICIAYFNTYDPKPPPLWAWRSQETWQTKQTSYSTKQCSSLSLHLYFGSMYTQKKIIIFWECPVALFCSELAQLVGVSDEMLKS